MKKCFFETYRFSEDLDFTLSESNHLDQEFLVSCFKEIAQWVYNESGIEIPQDLTDDDIVRGKIDSDRDDPDYERRPLLVIDGKEISWGELWR